MDGGTCGFNEERGRGRGREGEDQGSGPQHSMITLEDLETLSDDDQVSGSSFAEREMMEDEEQNRMLHFWQDAARGHRIEVPRDMAEPIQQLTTNNNGTHQRETVSFTLLSCKKKCGDLLHEKRRYDKAHWACTTVEEETYEQSIGYGFMKIMRYICQQNSLGIYLGMTIPILTVVRIEGANVSLSRGVTVAYYLPLNHQARPPQPLDPDIVIEEWPDTIVYTRAFTGATNESTLTSQINTLAEILDSSELYVTNSFIVAGYTNPAAAHCVNEIWFIQRQ